MKRLRHEGDVDFNIGNLKVDGDIEIEGSIKSRFRVEATGDVYVGGSVERRARIHAGGNLLVQRGIVGAILSVGGDLHARFIQDSEVEVGGDLIVRNYVQDSDVQVQRKATIQGNEGGSKQLCVLGGVMAASLEVAAQTIGSEYRKQTRVIAGLDPALEGRLEKYKKGLAFSDLRSRRALKALESVIGNRGWQSNPVAALKNVPPGRREFLVRQLKEVEAMKQLKESLKHHIGSLSEARVEVASRARIRVPGMAFQKVIVQVGEVYQMLDKEVLSVIFRLNHENTRIVQELLSGEGLLDGSEDEGQSEAEQSE
jgi:uncharacterized protein (DUF342 family)